MVPFSYQWISSFVPKKKKKTKQQQQHTYIYFTIIRQLHEQGKYLHTKM
jgi:hypothetical protein